MASVSVLCPNGRRVNVAVSPNKTILQILEEACKKQSYNPEGFDLKYGRKILDVTLPYRFANLPNKAQLELSEATNSRRETEVVVAVHLPSGHRIQEKILPHISLLEVLQLIQRKHEIFQGTLLSHTDDTGTLLQPVCTYASQEIIGEKALGVTTLKSLGIIHGSVLIRLIHRHFDEETILQINQEVDRQSNMQARLNESASKETSVKQVLSSSAPLSATEHMEGNVSSSSSTRVIPNKDAMDKASERQWQQNTDEIVSIAREYFASQSQSPSLVPETSVAFSQLEPHFQAFKFPEDSKGKHVYENELSATTAEKFNAEPCDRELVVYSLQDIPEGTHALEDPSDNFFDVTIEDVKSMITDLRFQRQMFEEEPLQTAQIRELRKEGKFSRYPRCVVRFHFPNGTNVQAVFRPAESVAALHDCVKECLTEENLSFYLYTTPPRKVLIDMKQRLVDVDLVPAAIVYVGSETKSDLVLKEFYMNEKKNLHDAELRASNWLSIGEHKGSSRSSVDSSETAPLATVPSAAAKGSATQKRNADGSGVVPKWFKTSK